MPLRHSSAKFELFKKSILTRKFRQDPSSTAEQHGEMFEFCEEMFGAGYLTARVLFRYYVDPACMCVKSLCMLMSVISVGCKVCVLISNA